jgi:hypothetical protein
LSGEPCFILGNGPSLTDNNINLLNDKYSTIGINSSYTIFDSTILLWQDIEFFYSSRKDLPKLKSILFCRDSSDPMNMAYHYSLQAGKFTLPRNPSVLHGSGASGPLAFQLAYVLGCDPIVLMGYDCQYRDGKTDFYGVNKFHKQHTMNNCNRGLKWIKECQFERRIVNCSDNKYFKEKRSLQDVLEEFDKIYPNRDRKYFINKLLFSEE